MNDNSSARAELKVLYKDIHYIASYFKGKEVSVSVIECRRQAKIDINHGLSLIMPNNRMPYVQVESSYTSFYPEDSVHDQMICCILFLSVCKTRARQWVIDHA